MKVNFRSIVTGPAKNFFSYAGWPSVCRDEKGVLYAVCSGNRFAHVCPFGKTLMYKSRDNGKTWSVPSIINDTYLDDRDAGIVYLGNGRLLMTTFRHPATVYTNDFRNWIERETGKPGEGMLELFETLEGEDAKGGSFMRISDDYGETWSDEIRIAISTPHGPIILSDGNLLYVGKEMYSYGLEEPETIHAYISEPDKIDFKKTGSCPKPDEYNWNQFHEPHCGELDDGRIIALYRSHTIENDHYFTIYKTFSSDKGKTWSTPEATGICGSPPHLLKLRDGRFVLTYGRRIEPYGIYGRIIEKDGTFGENEFLIDAAKDSDIGYPASVELDDGNIVTVAYKREISSKYTSIVAVNWTL